FLDECFSGFRLAWRAGGGGRLGEQMRRYARNGAGGQHGGRAAHDAEGNAPAQRLQRARFAFGTIPPLKFRHGQTPWRKSATVAAEGKAPVIFSSPRRSAGRNHTSHFPGKLSGGVEQR